MRFFSNDKDARDDQQGVDVQERSADVNPDQAHDEHPERVQSDPVAVPQQRAGSPWSSTPDAPSEDRDDSDQPVDQERADGTVDATTNGHDEDYSRTDSHGDDVLRPDDSEERHDGDDLVPSDSTTTATSEVGTGSHRADVDQPIDLPLDDKDDETVREDTTPPDHAVSDTAPDATVDGDSTTTTYGPDGTVTTTEVTSEETDFADDHSADADSADHDSVDHDSAHHDSADQDPADQDSADQDSAVQDSALKDDGGFADPQAVDPVTDKPLDAEDSSADGDRTDVADAAPVVAAVPVAAAAAATPAADAATPAAATPAAASKPGSVTAPDLGSLFASDDAQSFHERWRDVQLRFVDSPKEATSEAARLVDEAVDKLTEGLKAQKEALTGEHGEDTEKLRVELRGYRDILNRILAL